MHQFRVYQVGKRSKICQTAYHSQHYSQTCPYEGNLPAEYGPVHSVPSWEKEKIMSNDLSLTTRNLDKVQSNMSMQRQLTY